MISEADPYSELTQNRVPFGGQQNGELALSWQALISASVVKLGRKFLGTMQSVRSVSPKHCGKMQIRQRTIAEVREC